MARMYISLQSCLKPVPIPSEGYKEYAPNVSFQAYLFYRGVTYSGFDTGMILEQWHSNLLPSHPSLPVFVSSQNLGGYLSPHNFFWVSPQKQKLGNWILFNWQTR